MELYDSALASWPVPHSVRTVPTRHGDTFAISSGPEDAPALVLIHGAGTNSTMWSGQVAAYSRDHRVLAIDLPGEPGKSAPNRPAWDGPAFAEWLEDMFAGLDLRSATIVGLSQGAWTALKFASARPELVDALVLVSPGGIVRDKLSFLLRVLPLTLLGAWGQRRINRLVLGGETVPAEVEAAMALIRRHFKPRLGALPIFSDAELRRLTMPVQLVMGGRDALRDARAISERLGALIPNLTATILPEAGHAVVNAHPHIRRFLDGRPA